MALQVFNASFGDDDERHARLTALVADGEPWFRATEAAAALGYKNAQLAIRTHVDEDDKRALRDLRLRETLTLTNGNEMAAVYITESGLYSLIMRSKLPHAKDFKRWVTKDVLPAIRQTGMYRAPLASEEIEPVPPPSDSKMWDSRSARLDALKSSFELAQVVGIQLGEAHRKVIRDAVHEVLLPIG